MSFESHLIHLCTISRATEEQVNAHGLSDDEYAVLEDSQACRLVVQEERVVATQISEAPVITKYKLLLPANANIAIDDRVTAIALDDGTVMTDKFVVQGILPRRARALRHITVNLKRIA